MDNYYVMCDWCLGHRENKMISEHKAYLNIHGVEVELNLDVEYDYNPDGHPIIRNDYIYLYSICVKGTHCDIKQYIDDEALERIKQYILLDVKICGE